MCLVRAFRHDLRKHLCGALGTLGNQNFPLTSRPPIEEGTDDEGAGKRAWREAIEVPLLSLRWLWLRLNGNIEPERGDSEQGQDHGSDKAGWSGSI